MVLLHGFWATLESVSEKREKLVTRQSGLPDDRSDGAAGQITIVVRNGGMSAGTLVEKLIMTAGDPDHSKTAFFKSRHDLLRF